MIRSFISLFQAGIISPKGSVKLIGGFKKYGKNLLGVLAYGTSYSPESMAISDGNRNLNYSSLLSECKKLRDKLYSKGVCGKEMKVAVLGKNSLELVQSIIALSALGVDVFMINYEHSLEQVNDILKDHSFRFILCDDDYQIGLKTNGKISTFKELKDVHAEECVQKYDSGKLTVLTGGSTGKPKVASRKSSIKSVLSPFLAILNKMRLHQNKSVVISVPFCHGYGLAALIMSLVLRKSIFIQSKFNAPLLEELIIKEEIEVGIFVPTMIQRLIREGNKGVNRLDKVLSGGSSINQALIDLMSQDLRAKIYNLYGTSEVGFCVIGTPEMQMEYPGTIGKPIRGVRMKIIDELGNETNNEIVGELVVASKWTINSNRNFVSTGDLALKLRNGLIFLKGRKDDLIITGGENVYPKDIEQVLEKHLAVDFCKIVSLPHDEFGQEIIGLVQVNDGDYNQERLLKWLNPKLARFQRPKRLIVQKDLPFTNSGKLSKSDIDNLLN